MRVLLILISILVLSVNDFAQVTGDYYDDGHGKQVYVPLGDIAFADKVVEYKPGTPAPVKSAMNSLNALGIPNWDGSDGNFLTLGCGGSVTLKFTDNVITDVEGPDIFIFELGKYVEGTKLEISKDGKTWIEIGQISGGQTSVDIKSFVKPFESFAFIRLTDLKTSCKSDDGWPGADIDAVAAIGAGRSFSFKSSVLFDSGKSLLKTTAQKEIDRVVLEIMKMQSATVIIEGYTDSIGGKKFNLDLSQKRSGSVSTYLSTKLGKKFTLKTMGYGDQYPVGDNGTDEGREMNRRVEIIVIPQY
jgi:OOP family OmpA-OmpF porin